MHASRHNDQLLTHGPLPYKRAFGFLLVQIVEDLLDQGNNIFIGSVAEDDFVCTRTLTPSLFKGDDFDNERGDFLMNEETNVKEKLDLAIFTDKELEILGPMIEKELGKRRETRRKDALDKMRAIAEGVGMTPEELLGIERTRRPRGTSKRAPSGTAWQHPDYPSKVYRGGRRPEWLKALKEEGREPIKVA